MAESLPWHQEPYFQRTDQKFCSHFQAPPQPGPPTGPAIVCGDRWTCVADPMFRDYREAGGLVIAAMWQQLVEALIGPPAVGAGLPTTVLSVPRQKGDDLLLTLLHYVPVRKSLKIDVIAERMSLAGEELRCNPAIKEVIDVTTGEPLPCVAPGRFGLRGKGRLLLRIPDYFVVTD